MKLNVVIDIPDDCNNCDTCEFSVNDTPSAMSPNLSCLIFDDSIHGTTPTDSCLEARKKK